MTPRVMPAERTLGLPSADERHSGSPLARSTYTPLGGGIFLCHILSWAPDLLPSIFNFHFTSERRGKSPGEPLPKAPGQTEGQGDQ